MDHIQDINDLPNNVTDLKMLIKGLVEELKDNELEIEKAGSIGNQLLSELKRMQENQIQEANQYERKIYDLRNELEGKNDVMTRNKFLSGQIEEQNLHCIHLESVMEELNKKITKQEKEIGRLNESLENERRKVKEKTPRMREEPEKKSSVDVEKLIKKNMERKKMKAEITRLKNELRKQTEINYEQELMREEDKKTLYEVNSELKKYSKLKEQYQKLQKENHDLYQRGIESSKSGIENAKSMFESLTKNKTFLQQIVNSKDESQKYARMIATNLLKDSTSILSTDTISEEDMNSLSHMFSLFCTSKLSKELEEVSKSLRESEERIDDMIREKQKQESKIKLMEENISLFEKGSILISNFKNQMIDSYPQYLSPLQIDQKEFSIKELLQLFELCIKGFENDLNVAQKEKNELEKEILRQQQTEDESENSHNENNHLFFSPEITSSGFEPEKRRSSLSENTKFRREKQLLVNENFRLSHTVVILKKERQQTLKQVEKLNKQIVSLHIKNSSLEKYEKNYQSLLLKNKDLQSDLNRAEKEIEMLKTQLSDLENDKLGRLKQTVEREKIIAQKEIETLSINNKRLTKQKERLVLERESYENTILSLKNEVNQKTNEVEHLKREHQQKIKIKRETSKIEVNESDRQDNMPDVNEKKKLTLEIQGLEKELKKAKQSSTSHKREKEILKSTLNSEKERFRQTISIFERELSANRSKMYDYEKQNEVLIRNLSLSEKEKQDFEDKLKKQHEKYEKKLIYLKEINERRQDDIKKKVEEKLPINHVRYEEKIEEKMIENNEKNVENTYVRRYQLKLRGESNTYNQKDTPKKDESLAKKNDHEKERNMKDGEEIKQKTEVKKTKRKKKRNKNKDDDDDIPPLIQILTDEEVSLINEQQSALIPTTEEFKPTRFNKIVIVKESDKRSYYFTGSDSNKNPKLKVIKNKEEEISKPKQEQNN